MRIASTTLVAVVLSWSLLLGGCASSAPAPAPTQPPAKPAAAPTAAPTRPAEPTKAPAAPTKAPAAPTPVPAPKVDFPQKGKAITYIVPYAAGGGTDITARLLAAYLEKELGVPVQVVNRAGANSQVANTELTRAKPDGYTIGTVDLPPVNITYLLPDRGAPYTRKSFLPLEMYYLTSPVWSVKADSPFKTLKDAIDAARANPGGIKVGDTALMGPYHLANLAVEKAAGIKLTHVHFDGGGPQTTALMGGHIDMGIIAIAGIAGQYKSGNVRLLGMMSKERDKFAPDVPTFAEQGINVESPVLYPICGPAGIPADVANVLGSAIRKVKADLEFQKKIADSLVTLAPNMSASEIDAMWAGVDESTKVLLELAKEK